MMDYNSSGGRQDSQEREQEKSVSVRWTASVYGLEGGRE